MRPSVRWLRPSTRPAADATGVVVVARVSDASVAGGGVRTSHTAPALTINVATDAATSRAIPNHSTHARARSATDRGGMGLSKVSTIDLLDGRAQRAQHHQEGVGACDAIGSASVLRER